MKFAVTLVLGCLYFGFLKLAASDLQHAKEQDLAAAENVTEEDKASERSGPLWASAVSVQGPGPSPQPYPIRLVECFVCTGCKDVHYNTTSKLCPYTLDPTKQGRCVTYSEQYRHMKKPWYIRGCASERGSCADIRKAHAAHSDIVKLIHCRECEGDRCNKASHSMADLTMAFIAMMVTPLIAKYTLS